MLDASLVVEQSGWAVTAAHKRVTRPDFGAGKVRGPTRMRSLAKYRYGLSWLIQWEAGSTVRRALTRRVADGGVDQALGGDLWGDVRELESLPGRSRRRGSTKSATVWECPSSERGGPTATVRLVNGARDGGLRLTRLA
jgi:hypothetical protein